MAYTPIPRGTPDWDVPVNAAFTDLDERVSQLSVNVRDFGAKGDGASDDSLAIQQAIFFADTNGGAVFIPAGVYMLSQTLLIPPGESPTIFGVGWGSVLKVMGGANIYAITFQEQDTRITIRDLKIDGNYLEQSGASGGINAAGAVASRFDNLHFTFCRDNGLILAGQTGGIFGHNNSVTKCLFDQGEGSPSSGRGIFITSSDENQIIGCDFEFLGGAGATPACIRDTAGNQFIANCNFVNGGNNAKGVHVQDVGLTKIEGCNFDGLPGDNVFIVGTSCVVSGCTFTSIGIGGTAGASVGVYLEFANANNIITNNLFTSDVTNGQSRSAIRESADGGGGNNTIMGNRAIQNGTWSIGAYDISGTGSVFQYNMPNGLSPDQDFTPADHNVITWTQDPATLRSGGESVTAGSVYLMKVKIVNKPAVVSNITVGLLNTPAGLTVGQNFVGLYNSTGTLLAASADQTAAWATAGTKTAAITPQTLQPGYYYVALLANLTPGTAPQFAMGAGGSSVTNFGLTTATARFLIGPAAQTSLPASIALGSQASNIGARWAALT